MKIKILILLFVQSYLISFSLKAQPMFLPGDDGYACFRIPALETTGRNELIAFAEGRKNNCADFGNVDIVMKKSTDGGKTWSGLKVVVENDDLQAGNCAPVFDRFDPRFPDGRLILFYNTGNAHESEIRSGKGVREAWMITSVDKGETWSTPVNITLMVHKPMQPSFKPEYNFTHDWRGLANTPGHALQFNEGPYKGRIYVAANHTIGEPKDRWADCFSFGYFTDDHGESFHISDELAISGSNEATAAFLPNGGLLLNARNQAGSPRLRIQAVSSDGGKSWDTCYYHPELIDPVCEGSMLNCRLKGKDAILFCNPASQKQRMSLTLRASFDKGSSWPLKLLIAEGEAAYSDIAEINDRQIGCLYEKGSNNGIYFITIRKRDLVKRSGRY